MQAPLLTLMSKGLTTGLVIDSGHRPKTDVCPIIDGELDLGAVKSMEVSGGDISAFVMKKLKERGYPNIARVSIDDIKRKLCYVAYSFDDEMNQT